MEIGGIRDPLLSVRPNLRGFSLHLRYGMKFSSSPIGCAYVKYVFGETGIGSDLTAW